MAVWGFFAIHLLFLWCWVSLDPPPSTWPVYTLLNSIPRNWGGESKIYKFFGFLNISNSHQGRRMYWFLLLPTIKRMSVSKHPGQSWVLSFILCLSMGQSENGISLLDQTEFIWLLVGLYILSYTNSSFVFFPFVKSPCLFFAYFSF